MDLAHVRSVYRRLWRAGHYAVQYRAPGKYAIRDKLRHAFRTENQLPTTTEIDNTERFLRTAGRRRGLENNIVRGLCLIHWERAKKHRLSTPWVLLIQRDRFDFESSKDFYGPYERCVDLLNKTAGLCLRNWFMVSCRGHLKQTCRLSAMMKPGSNSCEGHRKVVRLTIFKVNGGNGAWALG